MIILKSAHPELYGDLEIECRVIENPKTGDITIFLVWVLGIGCLVYSVCYFRKSKESR